MKTPHVHPPAHPHHSPHQGGHRSGRIPVAKDTAKIVAREPIELVAIDLDGTLLRTDKALTRRNADAIAATMQKGVHVVLATARPPRSVREIYRSLKLTSLLINYNGALIHDPARRRHVFHQPMSTELTRSLIKYARKIDPKVVIVVEILDKWYTDHYDPELPIESARGFSPDFVGPLEAIVRTPATKLMLMATPRHLKKIREALLKKFSGQIALAISDEHLLQVIHPKVDKGNALAMIADRYKVPSSRIMAIGDAPNDIGMLRYAGIGVAVENAWPTVLAEADHVVASNDANGVAAALKQFVLG